MWRNADTPPQQPNGLEEQPLPIPVLLQQLLLPHATATAGWARCHTDVPVPHPYQDARGPFIQQGQPRPHVP